MSRVHQFYLTSRNFGGQRCLTFGQASAIVTEAEQQFYAKLAQYWRLELLHILSQPQTIMYIQHV